MALGFALFAATAAEVIRAAAREAEALGYTSFWVNHRARPTGSLPSPRALARPSAWSWGWV